MLAVIAELKSHGVHARGAIKASIYCCGGKGDLSTIVNTNKREADDQLVFATNESIGETVTQLEDNHIYRKCAHRCVGRDLGVIRNSATKKVNIGVRCDL